MNQQLAMKNFCNTVFVIVMQIKLVVVVVVVVILFCSLITSVIKN